MVSTRAERSAAKKKADDAAEAAAREALLALADEGAVRTGRLSKLPIRRKKWRVVTEIPAGPSEPVGTPKKRRWTVKTAAERTIAKTPSVESQEPDRASHESAKEGSSPSVSPVRSPLPSEPVQSTESSPPAQRAESSPALQSSDLPPAAVQSPDLPSSPWSSAHTPSAEHNSPRPDPEFPYGDYQESTQGSGDAGEEEVFSPMREDSPDEPAQQDDSMEETLGACLQQIHIKREKKEAKKKAKKAKKLKKKKAKRVPSADKDSTEPSLKRLKVEAAESSKPADKGKAKLYPEDEPPSVRYVSSDAESRGVELRKRDLLHEKGFLDRLADLPQFLRAGVINHGWEEFCRPPNPAYTSMVYDFYANVLSPEDGLSVVRGVDDCRPHVFWLIPDHMFSG